MNQLRHLSDLVTVRRRYQKSVHLERDAGSDAALAGYVITPLVRGVITRFSAGLASDAQQRAWSVTGPYGTGKSAMALLWSSLIGLARDGRAERARRLLEQADPEIAGRLNGLMPAVGGFVPVLATGERSRLDLVLLSALSRALEDFWRGRGAKPSLLAKIGAALQRAERGRDVSVREVVELFEDAARKVRASANAGAGLVVILDEAGKCLEYAAHELARGDVQLLQELAEASNRSGANPILFVTILHQSIERYATRLGATQRNEWAKVQGRFEDVAFQEESDQLLRLVGAALEHPAPLPPALAKDYGRLVEEVAEIIAGGDATRAKNLRVDLGETFPLHPITALVLGPLFRTRLAQNERSLFSFLCSGEPLGFRAHLDAVVDPRAPRTSLYRVDQLYDYVTSALGPKLFGADGRAWAEIDTALRRIPREAEQLDARVLKAIGLLSIVGDAAGVRASPRILEAALHDGSSNGAKHVRESLERLAKASAIVYRKYRDAYQIWEGSDLNLEDMVRTATDQTDTRSGLARRLTSLVPPRPVVARRHLFQTGTLRYFDVRYVEADTLEAEMQIQPPADADGTLLIALPRAGGDLGYLRETVNKKMFWFTAMGDGLKPVLIGVPRNASHLSDLAAELAALEWVQSNTPDLARDPVARRELGARIGEAERLVREEVVRLMDGSSPGACEWYDRGEKLVVKSAADLSRCISDVCDRVYDKAPSVLNELINRRNLSSAAAAARRNLMEAMLTKSDQERLGFEGYPPEVSMYRSVLEAHGLHRKRKKGEWEIAAPAGDSPMAATWEAIQQFLGGTEERRRTVADIYAHLAAPPFGIKDGLAPALVWAVLLDLEAEVALFEQGAFVPGLSAPVMERMLRWPEKFEVQRFKIAGVRAQVFERFGRALLSTGAADHPTLLAVVKALVKLVADLPDFTRVTRRVSPIAQSVRNTLVRAKEPAPLLFRELPLACDVAPFEANAKAEADEVERFFSTLRRSLGELQQAYPALLEDISAALRTVFELSDGPVQPQMVARSARLLPLAGEPELKAFLMRTADDALPSEEWLVSVATYLATKPPARWNDTDVDAMNAKLARLSPRFRALESLAVQLGRVGPGLHDLVRLAITQPNRPEAEKVVAIPAADAPLVGKLQEAILVLLRRSSAGSNLALAALARAAEVLIEDPNSGTDANHQRQFDA